MLTEELVLPVDKFFEATSKLITFKAEWVGLNAFFFK